jgi:hypothetical protein
MNELDQCYLEALSEALKGNLGEALELRNEADALASEGFSFSEDYGSKYPFIEEAVNTLLGSYDFTRCVRPDGSAYGTRGKCKKGAEQAKQPVEKKAKNNKERKEAIKEKRLTSNATWRLMRQVLDTPEVKSQFSSLEKKGDVEGARALYPKIEAEAAKKANAKEGRLAKGDSRTHASADRARASEKAESRKSPMKLGKEQPQAGKDISPRRRKTTAEYKAVAVQLFNLHKNARRKAREAEQELKSVEKETKGDNSREARLKRSTAEKAFMKADSNEERALKAAVKANSSYVKLHRKDELVKMSPQQKAAEKEIDKIIQERG